MEQGGDEQSEDEVKRDGIKRRVEENEDEEEGGVGRRQLKGRDQGEANERQEKKASRRFAFVRASRKNQGGLLSNHPIMINNTVVRGSLLPHIQNIIAMLRIFVLPSQTQLRSSLYDYLFHLHFADNKKNSKLTI